MRNAYLLAVAPTSSTSILSGTTAGVDPVSYTHLPVLALSYLYEYTGDETYGAVCKEWAQWVMDSLPKTKEGGFQHITSDTLNDGELWDDTLFMTCLLYTSRCV